MWKREDLMWAAGLLEGEGSFTHKKSQLGYLEVQVSSTDKDILEKLTSVLSLGKTYGPYTFKSDKLSKKPKYFWKIGSSFQTLALIFAIFPFMGNRRQSRMKELVELYQPPKYIRKSVPGGSFVLLQ